MNLDCMCILIWKDKSYATFLYVHLSTVKVIFRTLKYSQDEGLIFFVYY